MTFSYNSDKGKCYGVSEDTAAGCANPVEEESGKWSYLEFWCSEGHTTDVLCEADKQAKKEACDTENVVEEVDNLDDCLEMALNADLAFFSYNKKTDECFLPTGEDDGGEDACTNPDRVQKGNANKKSKVYSAECRMVEYISKDYYCDADYVQITLVAEETKCDDVSTADGEELTIAECNDFAVGSGMDWFAYRSDLGICWYGNAKDNRSCRNTALSTGKAWDVYAACGLLPEQLSDEEFACKDLQGCDGEECFVMWPTSTSTEVSWKCNGATQAHTGEHFQVCVDLAMNNNKMWMNYRTNNGACAVEDDCVPVQSGSNWQILLNCDVVNNQ